MQKCTKDRNYRKVRDHCHYTCKYKGAAHSICNLKLTVPNDIYILTKFIYMSRIHMKQNTNC